MKLTRSLKFFPPDGGLGGLFGSSADIPDGCSDLAGHVGNMAGETGDGASVWK